MRRQVTAYLSEEEFVRLRDEADERGITLSRYIKERLFQSDAGGGLTFSDAQLAAAETNHRSQSGVRHTEPEADRAATHDPARDARSVRAQHVEPSAGDSRAAA